VASALALALTLVAAGCNGTSQGTVEPTPTYIAQPTPNATMAAVLQGQGPPVTYLPPLEIKGSPTPIPIARPSGGSASRPTAKPTASQREPAPKPAPTRAAPKPAPTAAPRVNNAGAGATQTGPGPAPAIINPNTALPGGAGRPNPTPNR
jgi:hypothetical protein